MVMNLPTALLIFYLSAISTQPAEVETENVRIGRVPRAPRTRSLVRYRFPSRLAPFFKRSYSLPERAEDIALDKLLESNHEEREKEGDGFESTEPKQIEEALENEIDVEELDEPSKRSFFPFNDSPLTRRTIRWIPQRQDIREAFVKSSKSRFGYVPTRREPVLGSKRRRNVYSAQESNPRGFHRQLPTFSQRFTKRSQPESNNDVDWSDYFGVDKRSDEDEELDDYTRDIAFRRKRMTHVHPTEKEDLL